MVRVFVLTVKRGGVVVALLFVSVETVALGVAISNARARTHTHETHTQYPHAQDVLRSIKDVKAYLEDEARWNL